MRKFQNIVVMGLTSDPKFFELSDAITDWYMANYNDTKDLVHLEGRPLDNRDQLIHTHIGQAVQSIDYFYELRLQFYQEEAYNFFMLTFGSMYKDYCVGHSEYYEA